MCIRHCAHRTRHRPRHTHTHVTPPPIRTRRAPKVCAYIIIAEQNVFDSGLEVYWKIVTIRERCTVFSRVVGVEVLPTVATGNRKGWGRKYDSVVIFFRCEKKNIIIWLDETKFNHSQSSRLELSGICISQQIILITIQKNVMFWSIRKKWKR